MNLTIRYSNFKKIVLYFLVTTTIIFANSNLAYICNSEDGYSSDTGTVIIKDGDYDDWSNSLYGNPNNEEFDDYDPTEIIEV
jgi:hypothetical protein